MAIRLNKRLSEFKRAYLVKPTVTNAVSDLTELRSEDVDDLPQSAQLKRLWGHTKNLVVSIE